MSFGPLKAFRRSVSLRLSLLYALLLSLSIGTLLALAIYLLGGAVGSKAQELLEALLKEGARVYETGGSIGLRSWVANQPTEVQQTLFVRLVNPYNHTAQVLSVPPDWVAFRDVPGSEGSSRAPYLRIPQNAERDYTLGRVALSDGRILQIGPHHQQPRAPSSTPSAAASCCSAV